MRRRRSKFLLVLLVLIALILWVALRRSEVPQEAPEAPGIVPASRDAVLRVALPIPEAKAPVAEGRKPRAESPPPHSVHEETPAQAQPQGLAATDPVAPGTGQPVTFDLDSVLLHGAQTAYHGTLSEVRVRFGEQDSGASIPELGYSQERFVLVADANSSFRREPAAREAFRTFERASVDWLHEGPEESAESAPDQALDSGYTSPWIGRLLRRTLAGPVIDESPPREPRPPELPAAISGKGWDLGMHAFLPKWPAPIGASWSIEPAALLEVLAPPDDLAWVRVTQSEGGASRELVPQQVVEGWLARWIPGGIANQQQLGSLEGEISAEREGWMDVDRLRLDRARIRIDVTGRSEDTTLPAEFLRLFAEHLGETITARAELTYSIRGGGLHAWDPNGLQAPMTELHCEMETQMKVSLEVSKEPGNLEFSCRTKGQLAFLGGIVEPNAAIWESLRERGPRFLTDESFVLVR